MEQEKQKIQEEREVLQKKFNRMEKLYNKDMKNIEKMKKELLAAQNKADIVDLKISSKERELR